MRKRGDVSCQISSLQHKRSANGAARAERSVPSPVASISGRIPSPPIPASLVPSIPIVASAPPAVPIPPVPTAVARSSTLDLRPRPRPATIPRSIAFVATAPTPIVASIVPTSSIVSSIVSPIGTPRVHRPRRRSRPPERYVAAANRCPNSPRNSRTRFQPTYCFPVTCSARRDSLSADVSSTALTGHACGRLRHARFRGGYARFHRARSFSRILIWRRRLARPSTSSLPGVPPPPRPTI